MSKHRWNWRRKCGVVLAIENDMKRGLTEEQAITQASTVYKLELPEIKEWVYMYRKFGGLSLRQRSGPVRFNHSAPILPEMK